MSITRIFRRSGLEESPYDDATVVAPGQMLDAALAGRQMDVARDFVARYPFIKKAMALHREQGLLLLLFDPSGQPLAQGWLRASLDKPRATVVGRHSQCRLRTPSDHKDISLRHVLIMVQAIDDHQNRVRVIDLHTPSGFRDEAGRPLQAVCAEGSMFLRMGELELWLLATHPDDLLPEDGEDAYACIPARVFVTERAGPPDYQPPPRGLRMEPFEGDVTHVRSIAGPMVAARSLCADDEVPMGSLILGRGDESLSRPVSSEALDRGVLIGRYDRCQLIGQDDNGLSRVHLLVIREGGQILAIDTASTNGTLHGDREIRQLALDDDVVLVLPDDLTLRWRTED